MIQTVDRIINRRIMKCMNNWSFTLTKKVHHNGIFEIYLERSYGMSMIAYGQVIGFLNLKNMKGAKSLHYEEVLGGSLTRPLSEKATNPNAGSSYTLFLFTMRLLSST